MNGHNYEKQTDLSRRRDRGPGAGPRPLERMVEQSMKKAVVTISMISPSIPTYTIFRRIIYRTGSHNVHDSEVTFWKGKNKGTAIIKERMLEENI